MQATARGVAVPPRLISSFASCVTCCRCF